MNRFAFFSLWLFNVALVCLPDNAILAADSPNIVMIAIDDLNDWVQPLGGHPDVKTRPSRNWPIVV